MNKSTKGALAAAAGAVLLLGGAGSLAYWNDAATVAGGTINSGKLSLTDTTTGGGCAASVWTIDSAETPAGVTFNPASDTVVPGDVLTKHCTYKINAAGTHLRATVATSGGAATGTLATALTTSGTFTVGGAAATTVTSADDGKTLDATVKVTFPYGATADNSTQLKTATLSSFVVTLTQVHS
jgi:alternate signal-mediated exported protein